MSMNKIKKTFLDWKITDLEIAKTDGPNMYPTSKIIVNNLK